MPFHEYEVLEKMASGTFGIVFKARRITDQKLVVMKRIPLLDLSIEQRRDAAQEIAVMHDLHHPCVVEQQDAFLYNEYDLCLILEYYDGGDMDTRMATQRELDAYFSFEQVMLWFVQLVLGAQYLHARHVVHRDIKSHNVFVRKKDGSVSLGDFGISERFDVDMANRTWAAATMGGRRSSLGTAGENGVDGHGAAITATSPPSSLALNVGLGGTLNTEEGLAQAQQTSSSSAYFTDESHRRSPNASPHRPPPLRQNHQNQQQQQQQHAISRLRRDSSMVGASSPFFGSPQSPYTGGKMEAAMKGTPLYMAPEVLQGGAASPKSDVWSLGCVLYELLALRHPFESRDLATLVMRVSRGQREPLPSHYPRPIQGVINRMLHLDAAQRPTCEEVLTMPYVRAYVDLWRLLRTPLDVLTSLSEVALSKQIAAWQANVKATVAKHSADGQYASVRQSDIEGQLMPPTCAPSQERETTERRTAEAARAALLQAGPSVSLCSASSFSGATAGGVAEGTFFYGASGRHIGTAEVNPFGHGHGIESPPGAAGAAGVGGGASDLSSFPSTSQMGSGAAAAAAAVAAVRGAAPSESMRPHMVYDASSQSGWRASHPLDSPTSAVHCEESPMKSTSGAARRRQRKQEQQRKRASTKQYRAASPASPSSSSVSGNANTGDTSFTSVSRVATPPNAIEKAQSGGAAAQKGGGRVEKAAGRGKQRHFASTSPDPVSTTYGSADGPLPSTSPPLPLHSRALARPLRTAGIKPLPAPPVDEDALFFKAYHNVLDMRFASVDAIAEAVVLMRQRVQQCMRHQRVLLDIEQLHSRHGSAPLQSMPNVLNVLATAAAAGNERAEAARESRDSQRAHSSKEKRNTGNFVASASPEDVYAHMVRQIDQQRGGRQRQGAEGGTWANAQAKKSQMRCGSSIDASFPVGRPSPPRIRHLREVAALAEAAAARERSLPRQDTRNTASSSASSAPPSADPTAPLQVSTGGTRRQAVQRQRWAAYLLRRNSLSEALTHVFDPVTLRAVYAYYLSCPLLQRSAKLVRQLVPDRTQWTALPMVEELVVLDRRLQPLLNK